MSVEAVVELGVKGQDIVMSTFKKLALEKKAFEKKADVRVGARGKVGKTGQQIERETDEKRRSEGKKEAAASKTAKASTGLAGALETVGQGLASLNPVEFIRSAAAATVQLTAGLAGGAANVAWTGAGEVVRAIIEHAGKLVDMGIQAASGALNAYKGALPVEVKRRAQKSIVKFTGAGDINQPSVTRAEAAQMAGVLLPVVGKIGAEFSKQLKKLYGVTETRVRNKKNLGFRTYSSIVNRSQANALAQGDFSVLGTSKGWLLNQISQGTQGMPPEMVQAFRTGLLSQVSRKELAKESAGARLAAVSMEASDLSAQGAIVAAGSKKEVWKSMKEANKSLNKLQISMINSIGGLVKVLDAAATGITKMLPGLKRDIETTEAEAAARRRASP